MLKSVQYVRMGAEIQDIVPPEVIMSLEGVSSGTHTEISATSAYGGGPTPGISAGLDHLHGDQYPNPRTGY